MKAKLCKTLSILHPKTYNLTERNRNLSKEKNQSSSSQLASKLTPNNSMLLTIVQTNLLLFILQAVFNIAIICYK